MTECYICGEDTGLLIYDREKQILYHEECAEQLEGGLGTTVKYDHGRFSQ